MSIVLLTNDLIVTSRVSGAAAKAGVEIAAVSSSAALVAECRRERASIVLVDLNLPALDLEEIVNALESTGSDRPMLVAFGPHVHETRLAAAREAGCDEVLSRGQFFAQLDAILHRATVQGDAEGD
jgi:CheY-like chemotaxis protein